MGILLYFILFAAGLLMIIKGSDWFVDSAVWTAEVFRIPPIIIGATIVSICTTLPETFVSAIAALKGEPVLAIGNTLGSIGVNTGFILAILIISTTPLIENRKEFQKNGMFLILIMLMLWAAGFLFHTISRPMGLVLIALLVLYMISNVLSARKLMDLDIQFDIVDEQHVFDNTNSSEPLPEGMAYDERENDFNVSMQMISHKIIFFVLGVGFVLIGSNLLVNNGIRIAEILHVPTIVIAVFFTSVGTSLPELITVLTSMRKHASSLGIGNIIGANILNILQVIGISSLLRPMEITGDPSILSFQIPLLLVMLISLVGFGSFSGGRLHKWQGFWLLALYLIFLFVNILREGTPILGPLLFK